MSETRRNFLKKLVGGAAGVAAASVIHTDEHADVEQEAPRETPIQSRMMATGLLFTGFTEGAPWAFPRDNSLD